MKTIWNEARVRDELKCLDQKTGLCGAELPIVFNNAKRTLGSFSTQWKSKTVLLFKSLFSESGISY